MTRASLSWTPAIRKSGKPRYLAIADAIAEELRSGKLAPGDRLPPQRVLAERLDVDFTTVARGYNEAQRRGLIESRVGNGTFVCDPGAAAVPARPPRRPRRADLTMNLPPEPDDPLLLARMQRGLSEVAEDLLDLLRYQEVGGAEEDRQAGVAWLARRSLSVTADQVLVCPGAHSALLAVLGVLAKTGDVVCCEALTYPGVRALSAQLGLELIGLPMDADGVDPAAFEDLCRVRAPKAFYCNPTLQNPTAATIPSHRRAELADVARRHGVAIIEDDAYGLLPKDGPPAFATLAPELTFYVGGLAKVLGAGLRIAYLVVPDQRRIWPVSSSLRAANVMASPLTAALATRWIGDGTADEILAAIREESRARQALATGILPPELFRSDPEAFHLWLELPEAWNRSGFAATLRASGLGVVVSDAFVVGRPAPEAVRVCLGGAMTRSEILGALELASHALSQPPAVSSAFL